MRDASDRQRQEASLRAVNEITQRLLAGRTHRDPLGARRSPSSGLVDAVLGWVSGPLAPRTKLECRVQIEGPPGEPPQHLEGRLIRRCRAAPRWWGRARGNPRPSIPPAAPGLAEVLETGHRPTPWPPPSETMLARRGNGATSASSSRASSKRAPSSWRSYVAWTTSSMRPTTKGIGVEPAPGGGWVPRRGAGVGHPRRRRGPTAPRATTPSPRQCARRRRGPRWSTRCSIVRAPRSPVRREAARPTDDVRRVVR